MAKTKKIRLIKIAAEINIGKEAIVEYLQGKGFKIENKATASLSPEMVDTVYEKFKREKRAAEIQRDKLSKHKKVKKPADGDDTEETVDEGITENEESVVTEEVTDEIELEEKPAKDSVPDEPFEEKPKTKITTAKTKEKTTKEEKKADEQKADEKAEKGESLKESITAPIKEESDGKIVIDLEQIEKKSKPSRRKKKVEKIEEEPQEEPKANKSDEQKEQVDEEKIEKVKMEKVEETPSETEKTEEIQTEKTDTVEELSKEETQKKVTKQIEDSTDEKDDPKSKAKKKRKRKKLVEVEIDESDQTHLKGLTIVGKIELKKEDEHSQSGKRTKKGSQQKGSTNEDQQQSAKKGKSKRKKGKERNEKRKKKRVSIREMIKDEDVDRAIKETLSGMSESSASQRSKMRQKKKAEREEKEQKVQEELELEAQTLQITEYVTTGALADLMKVNPNDIIVKCMGLGLMVTLNQRLDKDTITLIADDYGFEVEFIDDKAAQMIEIEDEEEAPEDLQPRSPIVTVMGHVDHGKTSLLDFIRKTRVVAGEAGGITQHIGAYRVMLDNEKAITFLDTPGHEAFTAMRARGAQVTDLVVLVVAADDSVMPQTLEAISHAQAANVPMIVAINKMDKPDANPDRIKQQLSEQNILVEDWGGKYQSVEISAKKGTNVDVLLEKILLEAEMLDLQANPDRKVRGTVVEANMDKGLGSVATVIVQKGTLRIGDPYVAGLSSGRVRTMFDERGKRVKEAGPTIPVRVTGFDVLPEAGDLLVSVDSETEARSIATERQRLKREQEFRQIRHMTLDDISKQIQIGGVKDLYLVIKGDVAGSVEALSDSLQKQSTEEVRVIILHKGVGSITESDVMLAVASKAVIIGFQVSPTANARKLAEKESVDIRLYNIIYDAINEVRLALEGLLTPELREDITSTIEIRKVYRISKLGFIAGCYVKEGKITRNDRVRVLRDGLPVYNGTLHSLKREKEDVKEVETNFECGIMLEGFNDIEVGDIIQGYKLTEIKRTL